MINITNIASMIFPLHFRLQTTQQIAPHRIECSSYPFCRLCVFAYDDDYY